MTTPLDYKTVTEVIDAMNLGDFSQATIRDLQTLSRTLEEKQVSPSYTLRWACLASSRQR